MNTIPIRNVYYMLLYAFDKFKNKDIVSEKDIDAMNNHSDVLVHLFVNEVSKITQKGIFKQYKEVSDESTFVKGKINVQETIKRRGPFVSVTFDEYSMDIPLNRCIKKTLYNLLTSKELLSNKRLVIKLKHLYSNFNDVELKDKVDYDFDYMKHNDYYRFAVSLAYFINETIIPNQSEGSKSFFDFFEDEESMSVIYEAFLKNFYIYHTNYKVQSKYYEWYLIPDIHSDRKLLPRLETDVEILISKSEKIIIEAKFYKNAFQHKHETRKLISQNLYQINTYLDHNYNYDFVRGILLYPSNGYTINKVYDSAKNYRIEAKTLDLSQSWSNIESDLMSIISNSNH